jgi:hypothetical protein
VQQIRKIAFVDDDNSGSRHILSAILAALPEVEPTVVIATGLYYQTTVWQSILRMFKHSVLFCAARLPTDEERTGITR